MGKLSIQGLAIISNLLFMPVRAIYWNVCSFLKHNGYLCRLIYLVQIIGLVLTAYQIWLRRTEN